MIPSAPVVLPVTEEDKRAAWFAFYARPSELAHVEVLTPEQTPEASITLEALARVIAEDRKRVAERS